MRKLARKWHGWIFRDLEGHASEKQSQVLVVSVLNWSNVCVSPVAEVEVTEVAVLLNSVVQPLVQDLDEGTHIRKVLVHLGAVGEIAGKRTKLIVKMIWLIFNLLDSLTISFLSWGLKSMSMWWPRLQKPPIEAQPGRTCPKKEKKTNHVNWGESEWRDCNQ